MDTVHRWFTMAKKHWLLRRRENSDELRAAIEYQKVVLDALNIRNGPAHAEIKIVRGEPCLVEVGARCHGAEGCWRGIARESHGYDQISCTLDAYLDPAAFAATPCIPTRHRMFPRCAFIVSYSDGMLKEVNSGYLSEITKFSSYRGMEIFVQPGKPIKPTTDCFTFVGNVLLCHESLEQVEKDYARIREIENTTDFLILE